MGQHVWLLLATIITELLVIMKWSKGQFAEPFPTPVKWGWAIGATLLTIYPTVQVRFSQLNSVTWHAHNTFSSLVFQVRGSTFGNI